MAQPVDVRATERIETDVLVIGGGAAGVATATVAARNGLQVVLVERHGFCGGGAVAGHSGTVCGLYEASDHPGNGPVQAVFGFAQQFVEAIQARGGLAEPVRYGKTFTRVHDPIVWRETADALLAETGARVIYHAVATRALTDGGERIEGAEIWTKQGPLEVRAQVTVDASGDADMVAMAGLPSFIGDNGRVQNPTMIFRLMGVDVPAFLAAYGADTIMPPAVSHEIAEANASGAYTLPRAKIWLFPTTRPGELLCNCTRVIGADGRELNPLAWRDFAEAEIEGRRQAREYARFFRDRLAGCANAFVNDMAVQVGVRQTRQIAGVSRLANADVVAGTKSADGIARSPWPIELHAGEKPKVEWLLNDVYEVPYGCFVPARGEQILAAGRCLSAEHEAVASARVTAQCFSYGHAIGHAATIAVRDKVAPRQIAGRDLRLILNREDARLD
ncbi:MULTISPECIES: FAD-dependent oxidoreductase [unclassified Roseitalea]|uniref:FAD-dependent oxidoreductase n=1 Tax=unclassified Roseitalea TaxID=2639107 RepID=UPI00273F33FA|nr:MULTISPECIES: FAD-dependent oxidoreductase [unclassified Roseitalea]